MSRKQWGHGYWFGRQAGRLAQREEDQWNREQDEIDRANYERERRWWHPIKFRFNAWFHKVWLSRFEREVRIGRGEENNDHAMGHVVRCPFHEEITPSLIMFWDEDHLKIGSRVLSLGSGLWYCFGCQRGGDYWLFGEEEYPRDHIPRCVYLYTLRQNKLARSLVLLTK